LTFVVIAAIVCIVGIGLTTTIWVGRVLPMIEIDKTLGMDVDTRTVDTSITRIARAPNVVVAVEAQLWSHIEIDFKLVVRPVIRTLRFHCQTQIIAIYQLVVWIEALL
jgi:hypothetical protein